MDDQQEVSAGKPHALNVGCGRDIRTEDDTYVWVNLDLAGNTELRHDLDIEADVCGPIGRWGMAGSIWKFQDRGHWQEFDHIHASHVIEHVPDTLLMMQNLWQVAKPGATIEIRCPHGRSDDALEDPTHVRLMLPGSFFYFGQPAYWRADYGYRGDWEMEECRLAVGAEWAPMARRNPALIYQKSTEQNNVVKEMVVTMRAVKPGRPVPEGRVPWNLNLQIDVENAGPTR